MHSWVYDPHSGGVKIPTAVQQSIDRRVRSYADAHYGGKFTRLELRFRSMFCYIDAYIEPMEPTASLLLALQETREQYLQRCRNVPLHLCRLRFFGDEDRWSMAFYTYSNEKYEPCIFDNGTFHGTPEEAFETAAVYLQDF
jgi:hypothetical protein